MLHLSRRLFFRIFVWCWTAMTAVAFILLALETARLVKIAAQWRGMTGDAFAFYATSVAKDVGDEQVWEPREFLNDLEKRTGIRAWLFDARGREVSGRAPQALKTLPPFVRRRLQELTRRTMQSQQTELESYNGLTLAARAAANRSGERYVLAALVPEARYGFWQARPSVQALRLLATLVAAGLVSWVLARHLTQPLEILRTATHRLARGDLSARASPDLNHRRDELSDLAFDFDSMAERIEKLLQEQERLLEAQRRLVGDVAHELRSPLARVNVALELTRDAIQQQNELAFGDRPTDLQAPTSGQTSAWTSLDRIELETARLSELISRLLVLSRLESGMQKVQTVSFELADLVRAIAADADFEAQPRNRRVRLVRCDEGVVCGTRELLASAIENVMRNAVRHTPEHTEVVVLLARESEKDAESRRWKSDGASDGGYVSPLPAPEEAGTTTGEGAAKGGVVASGKQRSASFAVITVRDQGSGVPEDELAEVFRPFYRAGKGRDRQSGGTGLAG